MTLLSTKLRSVGYKNHFMGKWDNGHFTDDYLPVNRGFHTSSGFLNSGEDHFNQRADGAGCAVDYWKDLAPDHRNGSYDAYMYQRDFPPLFAAHDPSDPMFLFMS